MQNARLQHFSMQSPRTNHYCCRSDLMFRQTTNIATLHDSHCKTNHKEHPALLH